MSNLLVKLVLVGLLLLLITAPFGGLAPIMLILLSLGVIWFLWSLVQSFFTAAIGGDSEQARSGR